MLTFGAFLHLPAPLQAQPRPASQTRPADPLIANKLVWSTIAALDHANQTGNYSVLRDLGAPSFQSNNSAATLGGIFEALRNSRIDLSNTLLVEPTYEAPPAIIDGGLLRAKGSFGLRPTAIAFDLVFQAAAGQWRILGISVAPVEAGIASSPRGR
jgi:hypothetical protein